MLIQQTANIMLTVLDTDSKLSQRCVSDDDY